MCGSMQNVMTAVILKALAYLFLIAMGYCLKRAGKFRLQDKDALGIILMYITLPCAFVANFRNFHMSYALILFFLFGLVLNAALVWLGKHAAKRGTSEDRAEYMLQISGQNIGAFTTPFVGTVMDPYGTVVTSIYDIGHSIVSIGLVYPLAKREVMQEDSRRRDQLVFILKKLFTNVPFDTYLFMLLISLAGIRLPSVVSDTAQLLGAPSIILTMIMIGIAFEPQVGGKDLYHVLRILLLRYGIALLLVLVLRSLPFLNAVEAKALCYCVCAPATSISPAYASLCGCDAKVYGAVSSLSIVISLLMFLVLTAL